MNCVTRFFHGAWLLLLTVGATAASETISLSRQDQKSVPAAVYLPKAGGCRGIAIISPGAGGSEAGYRYLGEAMSTFGYLTAVIGHPESGRQALRERVRSDGLREGLSELITDGSAYRGRLMDIAAARQWEATQCNSTSSVLIGHSMGAATAMIEAGARNNLAVMGSDSFSSYIALSPQGAGSIFPKDAWSNILRPVLLLTGTRDNELGGVPWQVRTEPYASLPPGCKWLGVIEGATHMNFAGQGFSARTEALTVQLIGEFLDGLRQGNCKPPVQPGGIAVQSK
jgi:predicted dienelactone hydrolase